MISPAAGRRPGECLHAEGRTGDAARVFDWTRALLHFRAEHPALRRGDLVQLLVNQDQYAYLRRSPEEEVLIVLNRGGADKPIELDVDDLQMADGLRLTSFSGDPELSVSATKDYDCGAERGRDLLDPEPPLSYGSQYSVPGVESSGVDSCGSGCGDGRPATRTA